MKVITRGIPNFQRKAQTILYPPVRNQVPALVETVSTVLSNEESIWKIQSGRSRRIHWRAISLRDANIPSQKALGLVWHNRESECPGAISGISW